MSSAHQSQSAVHACKGLDCNLPLNEKKTEPEFHLWDFPWKARVIKLCKT